MDLVSIDVDRRGFDRRAFHAVLAVRTRS